MERVFPQLAQDIRARRRELTLSHVELVVIAGFSSGGFVSVSVGKIRFG